MRSALVTLPAAVLLVLLTPSPADAVQHGISRTFTVPTARTATHTIYCPGREHTHSGGAQISPPGKYYMRSTHPTADRKGWSVTTAPLPGTTGGRTVTLYALCA